MKKRAAGHPGPPRFHNGGHGSGHRRRMGSGAPRPSGARAFKTRAADQFAEITARIVHGPRIGESAEHSSTTVNPRRVLRPTTNGILAAISTS